MCDPKGYTNIELAAEIYRQVKSSEFQSKDIDGVNTRKLRGLYDAVFLRRIRKDMVPFVAACGKKGKYPSWVYQLTDAALKRVIAL